LDIPAEGEWEGPLEPLTSVATQNAGTTRFLDFLAASPLRPLCTEWYGNNLCTVDSEAALAAALAEARPDVLMLQEVWDQRGCGADGRPAEADAEPFSCSAGDAHQLERVLPADYRWACATGYPDNCVAFVPSALSPERDGSPAACAGRDCSVAVHDVQAGCSRDGRIAWLEGRTAEGPAALVVVHTLAGPPGGEDEACRAQQLDAAREALAALPPETLLLMAGDFNFDPAGSDGPDAAALAALREELGLARLPDDGPTHRMLGTDLDLVLARGWPAGAGATCRVGFVDEGAEVPMFDHALVDCR